MPETRSTAYDSKIEGNVIFTRFDAALNWVRKNSLWPMPMGLACCAIELMATAASRFDIARFGAEVMRFSPRQCDVMIVDGTLTYKRAQSHECSVIPNECEGCLTRSRITQSTKRDARFDCEISLPRPRDRNDPA